MKIEVTTAPDPADMAFLSEGIQTFNRETVPGPPEVADDPKFAVFARADGGGLAGGIRATAFWGYLTIELLWLAAGARGHGVGR